MKTRLKTSNDEFVTDLPAEENSFWKGVGKYISDISIPNRLCVETPAGNAEFTVKTRGTYIENGQVHPSMFIVPEYNSINLPLQKPYEHRFLTCIHRESNNYKFYEFLPLNDETWTAEYGRIGSQEGELFGKRRLQTPNESYMFWLRYYEKLSKGYVDQSDIKYAKPVVSRVTAEKNDADNTQGVNDVKKALLSKLSRYAQNRVDEVLEDHVPTKKQISACKRALYEMRRRKTVRGFNNQLEKLLVLAPRKARYIQLAYAEKTSDFQGIIEREEDLISAMEGVASSNANVGGSYYDDLEIFAATEEQKQDVLNHMSDKLKPRVKNVYRVIPKAHKKEFDRYVEQHHITKCKKLWHGSRNTNWLSILVNSLELHPNARINGKMFGQGIYFAPSSMQSWGYTCSASAHWTNEHSDSAYMALCLTAYGNPYHTDTVVNGSQKFLHDTGTDCIHAHGGNVLLHDEIIYFDEDAVLIQYLVEFTA